MALLIIANYSSHGAEIKENGLTVSVMSFNIRYDTNRDDSNRWSNRKELVYNTIRQHSPDVIGLQEALRNQLDELKKALPKYSEIGLGRDGGKKGEYSAILYLKNDLM